MNRIEVDVQSVGEFTNSHRYTTRAKVITLFNQFADFRIFEEADDFTLGKGVAALHFRAGFGDRFFGLHR